MAKRRNEHSLQHDSRLKRCCPSLSSVDAQLESVSAAAGALPSILALLGGRPRKRPYYFDGVEGESAPYLKTALCYSKNHAANVLTEPMSGSVQGRRSSHPAITRKKRLRDDCVASDAIAPALNKKTEADEHKEDCTYNSFQYWRVPLPELDLSLLEDSSDHSQTKGNATVCDSSSVAMET
ncbi:uncharacterized protein wu:fa19b12 [Cololabis saira]|uniref:uncharacterized protein wu:fa19b12 n=1 Tax=Cololabis saira TaxID=129043 RepID=UPI002AD31815|nr:uncharacterized protein wu:fa19b12 [Cololabis saira]